MGSLIAQLENKIIADSVPTNLSITDSHGSRAVIPCTLVDSSKGTDVAFLDYISSTSRKRISIVLKLHGSDAVKSKSGKGEPDFHGFQVEILKDHKGETLKALESNTCLNDDSTASDRVLDGTRLVAKYIGSEPRLYLESGKGETFKSSELGILESECSYSTARGLCSTRLVAKFTGKGEPDSHGSQAAILKEAISNAVQADFHGAQAAILLKKEISTDCKDSGWAVSESNTHQDDGTTASKTTTTDSGWADSESSQEGKGKIYQRTYVVDGSPVLLTGFQDGKNILLEADGLQTVVSSEVVKGQRVFHGAQALLCKEVIPTDCKDERTDACLLDFESNTCRDDKKEAISRCVGIISQAAKPISRKDSGWADSESNTHQDDGSTAAAAVLGGGFTTTTEGEDYLHLGRNAYLHLDGRTTKESISVRNDLKSVSPTVIPVSDGGKTPQTTDVPSADTERNTPQEDADSLEDVSSQKIKIGIAGPENNTHLDDGSTLTDKGFLVSENNTCHVGLLSTTAEGIVNEAISKDWEGGNTYQHLERNTDVRYYCERDTFGPTTKEAISLLDDLSVTGKGKTPQRSDVPCPDSESNTPQEDADSQEVQGSSMESLPSDIIQEILSRVPTESVLECKLVRKQWVTVIRGSNFANMHLGHQLNHLHGGDDSDDNLAAAKVEPCLFFACRIDDPDVFKTLLYHGGQVSERISKDEKYIYNQNLKRIYHPPMHDRPLCDHLVGSCNGLVCAFQRHDTILDPIYICNPLTREYVYLPQLFVNKEDVDPDRIVGGVVDMYGDTACGFGYVSSTNEYKVVRIHYLDYKEGNVEVYTLGSGRGWRGVGKISYQLSTLGGGRGIYANDAIYWLRNYEVVAFDLAKEEFRLLSFPPYARNRQNKDRFGLVVLGRQLCLYMDKSRMEIWCLMDSNGTWRMEFDMDYEAVVGSRERTFKPILLTRNREIIFLHAESALYSYDPKTTVLKMISNEASTDYFDYIDAVAHVNTFQSLEAMGENSKKYTVRPRRVRTPWDDVLDELDRVALGEEVDTTRFRLR